MSIAEILDRRDYLEGKTEKLKILIDKRLCKACDICIEVCPHKVFRRSKIDEDGKFYPTPSDVEKCKNCGLCELTCPDFAITIFEEGKEDGC